MLNMRLLTLATVLPLAYRVLSMSVPNVECIGPATFSTFIGENKDVLVEVSSCGPVSHEQARGIQARDNVCGAPCSTNCFPPAGGGPDPNECHVIADALLYDSQNVGALFTMNPANGTQKITMQFRSCMTYILNQDTVPLTYCRTAWSELVNYLALNCQATQNAHGGLCVANDQRWYVQVQTATG